MTGLNILLQPDGSIQWLQIILWLLFLALGYFIANTRIQKKLQDSTASAADWKKKCLHAENEWKGQRLSLEALQKENQQLRQEISLLKKPIEEGRQPDSDLPTQPEPGNDLLVDDRPGEGEES